MPVTKCSELVFADVKVQFLTAELFLKDLLRPRSSGYGGLYIHSFFSSELSLPVTILGK